MMAICTGIGTPQWASEDLAWRYHSSCSLNIAHTLDGLLGGVVAQPSSNANNSNNIKMRIVRLY